MVYIKLTKRQEEIMQIVKEEGPIPGKQIAEKLSLTRAALRSDLAILTMVGNLEARPHVGYFYKGSYLDQSMNKASSYLVSKYKSHPIMIKKSTSVYEAIVQIFLHDVGTIYAIDEDNHLAGVISRKDLLRASIGNQNLQELPVNVIMTRMPNIVTILPENTLLEACKKLIEHHIDSLPVVQEVKGKDLAYKVIGRITKTTISRAFIEINES